MSRAPYHKATNTPSQLDEAERLFIWGFRAMAQHQRLGWPTFDGIRTVYGNFQVEDAVGSVAAMLETFASTAHTAIELHVSGCSCVSDGESRLLKAMAITQAGDIDRSRRQFEQWLPELAADWIMEPARGLGRIFRTAGLLFPGNELAPSMINMQSWPMMSQALH
jgi:hypothetical protein